MKSKITYAQEADILSVSIDDLPDDMMDVVTSQPFPLILDMVFNKYTGALLEFEISGLKSGFDGETPEGMLWNPEEDTLYIHLHPDDDNNGMCDLAYHDSVRGVLVSLNRSRVGNLTGIEISGLEALLENIIDVRKN